MTQSRKVKSTVLCDKFNEMFCEFLNENCKAEITKSFYKLNAYIDIFLSSDIKLKYFVNDDCGIYDLMFYVDNSYQYRFTFYTYICAVHLSVYNSNDKLLSAYTFAFDSHAISRFFNSIQIIDNTSELEQCKMSQSRKTKSTVKINKTIFYNLVKKYYSDVDLPKQKDFDFLRSFNSRTYILNYCNSDYSVILNFCLEIKFGNIIYLSFSETGEVHILSNLDS